LHPALVCETQLCTAVQLDQGRLATVEHLLAALAGVGITAATLLVEGEEIPLLDGSAQPWVEAIAEVGLQPLGERPAAAPLTAPITLQHGQSFITALPSDRLRLGAAIEFPQAAIDRQLFSLELTPAAFVEQIAPARTFGFKEQVDQLRAAGLIKGGALDNALVCDGDTWLNPPLRFADEPVRHKLLDLLGDLALAGLPQAQVFAFRGSHGLHTAWLGRWLRPRPPLRPPFPDCLDRPFDPNRPSAHQRADPGAPAPPLPLRPGGSGDRSRSGPAGGGDQERHLQ